ncbi:MAG: 4Fe-4S binding protein [Proteobacteria bacterium]|nr:4Fe-4S binding protein [Pseudomonadota bacterium]
MKKHPVYKKLQKHLDQQAVGFPATRSGVELDILGHIFSPQEAEIACVMSYKPETAEIIFKRMEPSLASVDELNGHLDRIFSKGGLFSKVIDGQRHYALAPLVVGMYEMQKNRLTPEFINNFDKYTQERNFGINFLSTERPQMRTIPIAESITMVNHVSPFDQVTLLIKEAREPFAIVECICRKKQELSGSSCDVTKRKETCLTLAGTAEGAIHLGVGRQISRDEALSIIEQNQKEGLVLQPSNSQEPEFICSCCGCCCGMLDMFQLLPKPLDYWASNFHSTVDVDKCNGCGVCETRCQVKAIRVNDKSNLAQVDRNLCLGCGVCIPTCPKTALSLEKNTCEIEPPKRIEDLYDLIMEKKKGPLGKLKVTLKMAVDAIRTGRTEILKR